MGKISQVRAHVPSVGAGSATLAETDSDDGTLDDEIFPSTRSVEAAPTSGSVTEIHRPWFEGIGTAMLAPLFVAILGNLAGFGQLVHTLNRVSQSRFVSSVPGVQKAVHAVSGLWQAVTTDVALPGYDFWATSRVIPHTINEFPLLELYLR